MLDLKPGVYEMSAAAYHASPALGSTSIRQFSSMTALECRHKMLGGGKTTDQQHKGTAAHTAILEPHLVEESIAVWRHKSESGKLAPRSGKVWSAFQKEHAGKTIVTEKEWPNVVAMAQFMQDRASTVYQFLRRGDCERSYFAQDPETSLWVKTRPDNRGRMQGRRYLLDVKTIHSLEDRVIENAIAPPTKQRSHGRHAYCDQAAHYCDTVALVEEEPVEDFFFLFVRSTEPIDVRFMYLAPEWLEIGRERNRQALRGLAECIEKDEWPGYPVRLETIDCPDWARKTA